MTSRTATSYASTSAGTTAKSGSRRKFRRDRRQAEPRQQSVGSVQQPTGQPSQQVHRTFAGQCYRCDQMGHMARDCPLLPRVPQQQTQSQPRVQQQQAPVQQRQQTGGSGGSRGRGRVTHLTRADAEAAQLVEDSLGELSSGESVELAIELPTGDFVLTWVFVDSRSRRSPRTFTSYPSELVSWVSGSEFGLLVVTGHAPHVLERINCRTALRAPQRITPRTTRQPARPFRHDPGTFHPFSAMLMPIKGAGPSSASGVRLLPSQV
ncbi:hypothetical protein Taro_022112 [Colocasia esculenta]|uniref:CCHC-type domain-containing protein n=1 Tax=Colocasia esculenta TaxID=4460 RepID=A0A843V0Z2_COLES|nr:hypothetical protein [Colocasia esculenta]